jgi:hypothetical protein
MASRRRDVPDRLFCGDNLRVLRDEIANESVDLVYLDPPFNSNARYSVLFKERDGTKAAAQIRAFEDTWRWDAAAARAYQDIVQRGGLVSQALTTVTMKPGDTERETYAEPTVIWRLRRDRQRAHAEIVPHKLQTTLVCWIDSAIEDAQDFCEWSGALERSDVVRDRLLREGWIDVT